MRRLVKGDGDKLRGFTIDLAVTPGPRFTIVLRALRWILSAFYLENNQATLQFLGVKHIQWN